MCGKFKRLDTPLEIVNINPLMQGQVLPKLFFHLCECVCVGVLAAQISAIVKGPEVSTRKAALSPHCIAPCQPMAAAPTGSLPSLLRPYLIVDKAVQDSHHQALEIRGMLAGREAKGSNWTTSPWNPSPQAEQPGQAWGETRVFALF